MDGKELVVVVDGRPVGASPGHVCGEAAFADSGVTAIPPLLQIGDEGGNDRGRSIDVES
jgi:hypothetical protein